MTDKLVNNTQRELSIGEIQKAVCAYFCLTPENLLSKVRKREIVQARQIAMYLSRSMTKSSLSSIGSQIGGKDHATVLHSYKTVCDLMTTDKRFRQHVLAIEDRLKSTI
jgi:chromosomal replication initiator protein